MRIRLTGTAAECATAVELLRLVDGVEVLDVTGSYTNGDRQQVRVYLLAEVVDERHGVRR